jgi:hypothetical protein
MVGNLDVVDVFVVGNFDVDKGKPGSQASGF